LHYVFHVFAAPQYAVHQPENALLVPPNQFFKGGFLTALGQANQFRFFVALPSARGK
jgi:hypothetical protein